jgi:hypothetical protein
MYVTRDEKLIVPLIRVDDEALSGEKYVMFCQVFEDLHEVIKARFSTFHLTLLVN